MVETKITDYKITIVKLSNEDGGGYLATIPAIGAMGDGETQEEAIIDVREVGKAHLEIMREDNEIIPKPDVYQKEESYSGKILARIPKSLHKKLAIQSKIEKCSINQLLNYFISIGIGDMIGKQQKENFENQKNNISYHFVEANKVMWKNKTRVGVASGVECPVIYGNWR